MISIVGPQLPVLRSSLSILLSSTVLIGLGRRLESFRALTYSALIMLWLNPLYILSLSFQLSFISILALVVSSGIETPFSTKRLVSREDILTKTQTPKILVVVFELLKTTLFAFLFTLPLIINISGQVSGLAIITNVLIIPIIPFVTLLKILGLVPVVGQLNLVVVSVMQSLLLTLIHDLSQIIPILHLSYFSHWEIGLYYVGIVRSVFIWKIYSTKKV